MTETEIFTLGISGIALLVSFWNFYRLHFYKKSYLIGQVAAISSESRTDPDEMEFEFSFANSGNREMLIREVYINLVPWPPKRFAPEVRTDDLPIVIKPGEIKLVKCLLHRRWLHEVGKIGITVELEFFPSSSDGKTFSMIKRLEPCTEEDRINPSWLSSFQLANEIILQTAKD